MPFVTKRLESEEIDFGGRKTLILDVEKTHELSLSNRNIQGISYKDAIKFKENFRDMEAFKETVKNNDSEVYWKNKEMVIAQIDNIEEFYDIIWERTILELMFISQYYLLLISNPASFENVYQGSKEFEYWFLNNVKYNMLNKIKDFYIKTTIIYANKVSMNVYETDLDIKVKEILDEIENNHLKQVEGLLENTWNDTLEKYISWKEIQDNKRKSILFD